MEMLDSKQAATANKMAIKSVGDNLGKYIG
jgi:hypothetical protein